MKRMIFIIRKKSEPSWLLAVQDKTLSTLEL